MTVKIIAVVLALTFYRDALLVQLDKLESSLPEMTRSADVAAERLLAGGNLYAAGQEPFVIESYTRAGGTMMLTRYSNETALSENDVILVGAWTNDDEIAVAVCKRAKDAGAYVVLFSPAFEDPKAPLVELCDMHVVNFSVPDSPAVAIGEEERVVPISRLSNVTALWTYTAELVGSLTRKGKMPVMWQSSVLPGGRERNKRYHGAADRSKRRFHDDMTVPPQPEGWLGGRYIDAIRRQVMGLRGPVLEQLADAAGQMAECVRDGGTVHVQSQSHFTTYELTSEPVPAWIKADYEWRLKGLVKPEQLVENMKSGDIFFQLGYYKVAVDHKLSTGYVEAVRKAGAKSILVLCHAPIAPLDGPQPDMLIDAQWEYGDAAVWVPGYDVKILPSSGVLQTAIFWTVIAETERLLGQ